jgi:hypothetical protein
MSSLPPLDLLVSSRRMSCVLDGELALSRQGLLFATRLAQEADVWLFRALWQVLDNSYIFRHISERSDGSGSDGHSAFPSVRVLQQWEAARLETDLSGLQFFFVGDARHESLLPKEIGKDLVKRFETFSDELDALHRQPSDQEEATYDPIYECWRDAAALATALIRHRPLVFSLCRKARAEGRGGEAEPALCGFLRRCGIDCHLVGGGRGVTAIRSHLQPTFARCGLAELLWDMERGDQQLAVIHMVAPHALVMPVEADLDGRYGEESPPAPVAVGQAPYWFHEAKAYWWKYA